VAFKVDNYREEKQKSDRERRDKAKFQMLIQALQKGPPTSGSCSPGKS
jgi:gamma-glutamyl-gamma-aminobutyrate hydrolase PuuD